MKEITKEKRKLTKINKRIKLLECQLN